MPNHEVSPEYLSLHIPKTAGLTLAEFFYNAFPKNSVYYYYKDGKGLVNAGHSETRSYFDQLRHPCKIVHGHDIDKQVRSLFPEAKLVTALRDPLSRAISHYFHVRYTEERRRYVPSWSYNLNCNAPLEEFLLDRNLANFQSKFISEIGFEQFSLIGITEMLPAYCDYFDPSGRTVIFVNNKRRSGPETVELQKSVVEKFSQLNREDLKLYKSVLKQWR